ncbi:hypothetical protein Trydic_g12305, partial [Trypoxylus dichotomus]
KFPPHELTSQVCYTAFNVIRYPEFPLAGVHIIKRLLDFFYNIPHPAKIAFQSAQQTQA